MKQDVYATTAQVTNTNTGKTVEAEIADLKEGESLNAYVANERISMRWNGKTYVGNMFGMELTTAGPKLIRTINTKGRF